MLRLMCPCKAYKDALEEIRHELDLEDGVRLNNILLLNEVVKTEKRVWMKS